MDTYRSISTRVVIASLLGALATFAATSAKADTATAGACDPQSLTCTVGTAPSLSGQIKTKLPTEIDSGWMDKGLIKVRTRFTIDPVDDNPLVSVGMQKGALVNVSWPDKGYLDLKPVTGADAQGTLDVRYKLVPSLDAQIYGISVSYDSTQLVNMIPGASFNYDSAGSGTFAPWGWKSGAVSPAAPTIDQSTIFSIGFDTLGVPNDIVEGTLAIEASARPTFTYTTKSVNFNSESVKTVDGVGKLAIDDVDSVDVSAYVVGEVALTGSLDVKPVVQIDTVDGYPTFGLTKFSFNVLTKDIGGSAPTSLSFQHVTIHVPLPNVKVPSDPLDMGTAKSGEATSKSISIDSTGEMDGLLTFESSDPQFTVPSGSVRVSSKDKYDLKIGFNPTSDGPASATITVHSNDPDSPDQTLRVAANGAPLDPDHPEKGASGGASNLDDPPSQDNGCACTTAGASSGGYSWAGALAAVGAVAIAARRRRR